MSGSGDAARTDHRLSWLLSSATLANLGDGIGKVAFPLLATTLTRDPVLIAGLSATLFLPWLLFAVVAGALLDRIDRRRAVMLANTVRAVVVGLVAVLVAADVVSIWLVYAAALVLGTAETVAESAANVLIPAVVEPHRLEAANSKFQACEIVGQTFAGGPLGSATFAVFAAFPFLLNSLGVAIAAALLLGLAGSYRPKAPPTPTRLRADLRDGMRWLRGSPLLLRLVVIAGMIGLTSELAQAQLVLYALQDLKLSDATFGLFAFVGGVGGLAGAAVAPRLVRLFGRRAVLVGGTVSCGVGFGGDGLTSRPVVAAALFGLFAASVVAVNVVLATIRHSHVPSELLGRVLGVWRTVVWGAIPVGALLGGLCTDLLGSPSRTFLLSGVLLAAAAVVALVSLHRFSLEVQPVSQPIGHETSA